MKITIDIMRSLLLSSVLLFSMDNVYSQYHVRKAKRIEAKYGIVAIDENGDKHKPNSSDFDYFLNNEIFTPIDKEERIQVQSKLDKENNIEIIDTVTCFCRIDGINIKRNNYFILDGKIKRKKLFIIDISILSSDSIILPKYVRILSWDHGKKKNAEKIKKNRTLKLNLISAFEKDCCVSLENGVFIHTVRKPDENRMCFLLDDIWIVYLDILSFNLYFTSNLSGLYYLPCK